MPPRFKNEHLEQVKTALMLHGGPAVDVADIHRKLAYYDALLERAPLDRVLPKDVFAAFDAFWIAGEYGKAYDFVTYYPTTADVDPEQRAFANELWNLLDSQRWSAIEKMEAHSDRVKRFFGSGVQPLPATWQQQVAFDGYDRAVLSYRFSEGVDALATTIRAAVYPCLQDAMRLAIMNVRLRVAHDSQARIVTEGSLLDFIDHPRAIWAELIARNDLSITIDNMPSHPVSEMLRVSKLMVFVDGWKGNGPRLARSRSL